MKKILAFTSVIILLCNITLAQELSKEETKSLKEEVKAYLKDLPGYKAKMQDIRVTLDSNDAEIRRLKDDMAYCLTRQAELENQKTDLLTQLEKCHEENNILRGNPEPNADTALVKQVMTSMNNAPKEGTVYKVQFGLYKEFSINKYFEQPRYIGYEDVDGMNRYIISYFTEEQVAIDFVGDVRKMGIKDAFVAKYIDGQRVYEWSRNPKYKGKAVPTNLEEALEMDKKGKKGKKNN